MTKTLLSIGLSLILLNGFSQKRPLKELQSGDTLIMRIEKVASLYGLDSRVTISLTEAKGAVYFIMDTVNIWREMTAKQYAALKKFERVGINRGCHSTQYAHIETNLSGMNRTRMYRTCWENVDLLLEELK